MEGLKMKLVLLSGGSGKRLWPLSNDSRSKQFLKVLEDENHELVSMVQRVWGQISNMGLNDSCMIATSESQVEIMQTQLGFDVPLIIEPERRDTFPAIALAATYLYSEQSVSLNEVITILPVDPFVEDHFFTSVKKIEKVFKDIDNLDIALIGVKPTYPSSKYGYIIPESNEEFGDFYKVMSFQEKPSEDEAVHLINQNALWNCGVFSFRLNYVISLLQKNGFPIQYEELKKKYDLLPKISFDYEVVEKANNIMVLPYHGYWKDLGTWNTLTEEMGNKQIGIGIISEDCINTHLINEIDLPVTVLGVSDVVVAVSPDGILVTDKSASPKIKDIVNFNKVPMYEEKQWGSSKTLDIQKYTDGKQVVTKRLSIQAGKNLSYKLYRNKQEVWNIVKGEGEFIHNGNYMKINAGNVLHIPSMTMHGLRAISDIELISVQTGDILDENDMIEVYSTWNEISMHCIKSS